MSQPEKSPTAAACQFPDARTGMVSCIIIFLDEEKYLAEAIESVIAQSYEDWELLLVDDGSTDGSEAIARSYCERFPTKMRYLTHEGRGNRGMSASRNLGLGEAQGEFGAFLDGDDCWLPDKLDHQGALFREHPRAIMICGATLYWHGWSPNSDREDRIVPVGQYYRKDGTVALAIEQDRLHEGGDLLRDLYPIGDGIAPSASGNMFRRDIALAFGGHNEAFRGLYEDQVFTSKVYLRGPVFVSSKVYDRYRQHDESCCVVTRAAGQSHKAREHFFQWLSDYLEEAGFHDRTVRWKLARRTLRYRYPSLARAWFKALGLSKRGLDAPRRMLRLATTARSS